MEEREIPVMKLVRFDKAQEAQIGAALLAAAAEQEHVSTGKENTFPRDGKVLVSLLNATDDNAKRTLRGEVLGYLDTQSKNSITNGQLMLPINEKSMQQRNSLSPTSSMIAGSELKYLQNGDVEYITTTLVKIDATDDLKDYIDSTVGYYKSEMIFNANGSMKSSQALLLPQTYFQQMENSVVADNQRVPATETVPPMVTEISMENATKDNNNAAPSVTTDVIEIDDCSNDNGNMDAETEMNVISLLDSDGEDNVQATSTTAVTTDANVASNNHVKTIDKLMSHHCPQCNRHCGSLENWRKHMQVKHNFEAIVNTTIPTIIDRNGGMHYLCNDCPTIFQHKCSYGVLMNHHITHMPFPCYLGCIICPSRFKNRVNLRYHFFKEHYNSCKEFLGRMPTYYKYITLNCPVCNEKQSTTNQWRKHLNDKHGCCFELSGNCKSKLAINANSVDDSMKSSQALLPPQTSSQQMENSVVADNQRVPATEIVPQVETENSMENATNDNNNATPSLNTDVIIMDDDSNDNGNMDTETEMNVIGLLHADGEDNVQATSTTTVATDANVASNNHNKTLDMLMNYHCPECNHHCGSLKNWRAHMQVKHNFEAIVNTSIPTIIDRNGRMHYLCNDCPTIFQHKCSYGVLMNHRITHMPFPCYLGCIVCPSRFKNCVNLRYHFFKEHYKIYKEFLGRNPTYFKNTTLDCPVCNEKQSTTNQWRKHLNDKHNCCTELSGNCKSKLAINANSVDDSMKSSQPLLPPLLPLMPPLLPLLPPQTSFQQMENAVVADSQSVPATEIVPQVVTENSLEDGTICVASFVEISAYDENALTSTNDNNSATPFVSDDVIELDEGSDDDIDMDAETEIKLIELFNSDGKNNVQEQYNEQATSTTASNKNIKTFGMLIHYYCPKCDHPCGSLKNWRTHMQVEHNFEAIANLNMQTITDRNGELQYHCKDCPMKFQKKSSNGVILNHCITHMPYPCYLGCIICRSRFEYRVNLRYHLSKEHYKTCKEFLGRMPTYYKYITLYCPVCNEKQSTTNQWRKHLDDKHDYSSRIVKELMTKESIAGFDVYTCRECNGKFGRYQIFQHCITHEAFWSMRCKLCSNYSCSIRSYIRQHIRQTHLQLKQPTLQCRHCESKFLKRSEHDMHVKQKHPIKKFKCKVCDCVYKTPESLLAHMRNHFRRK